MCAMFIILVAFASVKVAFYSVMLALFSRASGLIWSEYTVAVRIQRTTTARFVFAYIFTHLPGGVQYGVLFDGYGGIQYGVCNVTA